MVANLAVAAEVRIIEAEIDHQVVRAVVCKRSREEEGHPAGGKNRFVVLVNGGPTSAFPGWLQVLIKSRVLEPNGPVGKCLTRWSADKERDSAQIAWPAKFVAEVNDLRA